MTSDRDMPTIHFIEQARRVAELLDEGYGSAQIASELGVSQPRVSQIRQQLPSLEAYLGQPAPIERLRSHREQLWTLRHHALQLAATVRRDLKALDEELQAAEIDELLGLRPGKGGLLG